METTYPFDARVLAIVRYRRAADLARTIDALAASGILVEITLDTPGATEAIAAATARGLTVGAGTVIDAEGVRASADVGARFVVSPGLVDEVVETALALGLEPLPGIATPTELLRARALGARSVKVFPAATLGGPAFIQALRAPFPGIGLIAVGGVDVGHIGAYLDAGADAVALGRGLVGSEPPADDPELEALAARASEAAAAARR